MIVARNGTSPPAREDEASCIPGEQKRDRERKRSCKIRRRTFELLNFLLFSVYLKIKKDCVAFPRASIVKNLPIPVRSPKTL